MDDAERFRIQMMGFIDDELGDAERREFIERCYADPELARELAQYRRLAQITQSMRLREPEDYEYERFFSRVSARVERRAGLVLLGLGILVLGVFGLVELFFSDVRLPIKIGLGVSLLGASMLVSSVVRVWIKLRRLDRYQGVRR